MGTELTCQTCGFERTAPWPRRIPSFWSGDCGFGVEEYVHAAVEARRSDLFDPRIHRNQGFRGNGNCAEANCARCEMMRKHGV